MEKSCKSICYVLFCFQSAEYVAYLLASIVRKQDLVLIHCDIKAPPSLKGLVARLADRNHNIALIKPKDYSWAGYSHVAVCMEAIEIATSRSEDWTHVVFLSEQHLPLKAPDDIAASLQQHGSMVAIEQASQMSDMARADIANRFSAVYKELPGVGSFAVGLAPRKDSFYEKIFHGSNWMALSREHSNYLLSPKGRQELKPFEQVVHAEETAFQSVIAPYLGLDDNIDITRVAWPHLTDNHDLVMTEKMYTASVDLPYLFIRKRTKELPVAIDALIKARFFRFDIYNNIYLEAPEVDLIFDKQADACRKNILKLIDKDIPYKLQVHHNCRPKNNPSSAINIGLTLEGVNPEYVIRIISENLTDYKVCLLKNPSSAAGFVIPFSDGKALRSTARVKIYGLFSHEDILPDALPNDGFVTIHNEEDYIKMTETLNLMIEYIYNV